MLFIAVTVLTVLTAVGPAVTDPAVGNECAAEVTVRLLVPCLGGNHHAMVMIMTIVIIMHVHSRDSAEHHKEAEHHIENPPKDPFGFVFDSHR